LLEHKLKVRDNLTDARIHFRVNDSLDDPIIPSSFGQIFIINKRSINGELVLLRDFHWRNILRVSVDLIFPLDRSILQLLVTWVVVTFVILKDIEGIKTLCTLQQLYQHE
jgi:hypothetical protein